MAESDFLIRVDTMVSTRILEIYPDWKMVESDFLIRVDTMVSTWILEIYPD